MKTALKLKNLKQSNQDFEWYPTTTEIMQAMKDDLFKYSKLHFGRYARKKGDPYVDEQYDDGNRAENLIIPTMLDIGAGDGRVLNFMNPKEKNAIEIATVQADDLIKAGTFLIGRDFNNVDLSLSRYTLIFCNPPYSVFDKWVCKILLNANFSVCYMVIPQRWKENIEIKQALNRGYETNIIGTFDFEDADRKARSKVELIRINAEWKQLSFKGKNIEAQETIQDAFEDWVSENIASFENIKEKEFEEKKQEQIDFYKTPINRLLIQYEEEKTNLQNAFKIIGKLSSDVIKLLGQDKKSMIKILKDSIKGLKLKYWRACFEQLDVVKDRMVCKTKNEIFKSIERFSELDFNSENIYSIVIWIINNTNVGIKEQIEDVFEKMTGKDYIKKPYKSNKRWSNSNWRYEEGIPKKYILDYRIIVNENSGYYNYNYSNSTSIIKDFIVICNNLGWKIKEECQPDFKLQRTTQQFFTLDNKLAFEMKYYQGNGNAHLKINQELMKKFNIEVGKIKNWLKNVNDIVEEFEIPAEEAVKYWNTGCQLLGQQDFKMIGE